MLMEMVSQISKRSELQRKKLSALLDDSSKEYIEDANALLNLYIDFLKDRGISLDDSVDAYLEMCRNMLKSQIFFSKTGKYPCSSVAEAYLNVYSNKEKMTSYMVALAVSQILWKSHYNIYKFFRRWIDAIGGVDGDKLDYLEIGPGHGLFLLHALNTIKNGRFVAVDISEISLAITQDIIKHAGKSGDNIEFISSDFFEYKDSQNRRYDLVVMGEVLEHVEDPVGLLKKVRGVLSENGTLLLSTCINCPAIDHVYQFDCINDIRGVISDAGYSVLEEGKFPVENVDLRSALKQKITINYCASLSPTVSNKI